MTEPTEGTAYGRGNKDERTPRLVEVKGVGKLKTEFVPHPAQSRMFACEKGVIMSSGALGSGKSEPAALMLIRWALRYPRRDGKPTQWYAIAPDYNRIRKELFKKLLGHLRRLPINVVKRVTLGADPKIVLLHGQTIFGCSATDPDRLRGYEIDGVWIDEAEKVDEKAFRIASSRLRSTDEVRVLITGSPEDFPSWNWNLISGQSEGHNKIREKLIESGSGFWCFRWSSKGNKSNSKEVLGTIEAIMDASARGVAAQELEGRYPGTHEAPRSGRSTFSRAFVGRISLSAEECRAAVLGVDLGMTHDFTWLTVVSRTGVVLAMERFNVSSPEVSQREPVTRMVRSRSSGDTSAASAFRGRRRLPNELALARGYVVP